jgi:pre-mRNA-splicing factor CWC26
MSHLKLSTGHSGGLHSSTHFKEVDQETKEINRKSKNVSNPELTGENAETIYRDRKGKKLDMLNEFMKNQTVKDGKKYKIEEAQYAWGSGSVQK